MSRAKTWAEYHDHVAAAWRKYQMNRNAAWAKYHARNEVIVAGRPAGVYWEQTGGKTHRVTIVREDEPPSFRGIRLIVKAEYTGSGTIR